jgi:large subunit ribosomal protein L33
MCRAKFSASGVMPAFRRHDSRTILRTEKMAKAAKLKIKLLSTADTGFFYVTSKNSRTKTDKMSFRKYDPVVKKHVEFKETKIK